MDFGENALKGAAPEFEGVQLNQATIKVIGAGGAGNNMVNWLYHKGVKGATIIACNTDKQHLDVTESDLKFLIGKDTTRGLGCGGFPEKGA
ncbi:MAG: cell division protein FtsZ, partial [Nanoarchaeota archaeon]|nr:cell division protein FtsZ [Nanoarchaeota archaeon]